MNASLKIKPRINLFLKYLFAVPFFLLSCKEVPPKKEVKKGETKPEVEIGSSFENLLIVDEGGVTGADGAISFPLKNGKSVFMMGDSFLCPVMDKKRDPDCKMINNTFIVVDRENETSESIYKGTLENPKSLLAPAGGERTQEYYWPGHGFEHNGVLHVFMSKFWDDPSIKEGWKFKFRGTDYLRLEPGTFEILSQEYFPFTDSKGVHYGHSMLKNEDYTYVYGSWSGENRAELHVARAKMDTVKNKLTDFKFFDGETWAIDAHKSAALKGIEKNVPEQFSVFKQGENYVLVMQERGIFEGNIYSYVADSPTGPWENETLLYHTTEQENTEDKIITYNAMAHPQYIQDDKLLVSYCVNSLDVFNIHEVSTDYYRPKFIWVPLEMILE